MSDNISRADAIEEIESAMKYDESNVLIAGLACAKGIIASLPSAEAEWIPVSERLPSEDGVYLIQKNMRLIDADALRETIYNEALRNAEAYTEQIVTPYQILFEYYEIEEYIDNAPTVDAVTIHEDGKIDYTDRNFEKVWDMKGGAE